MISKWLFFGVAVLSLVLGYTVGVSSSPVANVIIPALFTLLTAGSAIALRKKIDTNQIFSLSKVFGVLLVTVSLTYLLGSILGANARVSGFLLLEKPQNVYREFPWIDRDTPDDIRIAIDWLGVQEMLLEKGYTKEQIVELYDIPGSQAFSGTGIFGQTERLSNFLPWGAVPTPPSIPDSKTVVDTIEINGDGA